MYLRLCPDIFQATGKNNIYENFVEIHCNNTQK